MSDPIGAAAAHPVAERYRVAFLFNAQLHQLMHGITTAIALARDPDVEVHVIGASAAHLDHARRLIALAGGAPIALSLAGSTLIEAITRGSRRLAQPKLVRLAAEARRLAGFDAIALPERTSILLRRLGITGPRFIHLDHGAGDRAVGFDPRIKLFDFVLLPGQKTRARMLRAGYIRPGAHAVIGYPKFDAADALRDAAWSPFADDGRPIVLYNPHFGGLGSWRRMGIAVLEAFAAQDRYNLIVAPHVRLFDAPGARARAEAELARFAASPRIHLDLGSERSVDMSYTMLADVYLGDVSSQVYEFLRWPRPCLFLDGRALDWRDDENYAHWHFGPVLTSTDGLVAAVDAACADHAAWRDAQAAGFAETFHLTAETSSTRAARAIATFLRYGAVDPVAERGAPAAPPPPPRRRPRRARAAPAPRPRRFAAYAAGVAMLLGIGWLGGTVIDMPAAYGETIVDEALESHEATMLRVAMRSQVETPALDAGEIRRATTIHLPVFPPDWQITDVQVYPSDAGPAVQIAVRTGRGRGQALTLLALRDGVYDNGSGAIPRLERRGAETVAYWTDDKVALGLVGRASLAEMRGFAERIAPAAVPERTSEPG